MSFISNKLTCLVCLKIFTKKTLLKNNGLCGRCYKKIIIDSQDIPNNSVNTDNSKCKYVNINDKDLIKTMDNIIILLNDFKKVYGFNPLDNYKYREIKIAEYINKFDITYKCNSGRKGFDFINSRTSKGESKSCILRNKNILKAKFEFDKQNLNKRRIKTLEYEAFSFGIFSEDSNLPLYVIYVNTDNGLDKIREIIRSKQNKFVSNNNDFDNTARRDTIIIINRKYNISNSF